AFEPLTAVEANRQQVPLTVRLPLTSTLPLNWAAWLWVHVEPLNVVHPSVTKPQALALSLFVAKKPPVPVRVPPPSPKPAVPRPFPNVSPAAPFPLAFAVSEVLLPPALFDLPIRRACPALPAEIPARTDTKTTAIPAATTARTATRRMRTPFLDGSAVHAGSERRPPSGCVCRA